MTNKKRFKKIPIIIIIILLFFTFSFLIGSTNGKAEVPLKLNDDNTLLDDGEVDSNHTIHAHFKKDKGPAEQNGDID